MKKKSILEIFFNLFSLLLKNKNSEKCKYDSIYRNFHYVVVNL
ncbi:hypothetical protein SR187_3800 [Streptococcus ruminantium]|uniref:Uncharacterized protein n=1 Tax=Streptococcus ruminantium TaxID=1917441 RepID=A0A2Z5TLY8_9STRE|nr:hypothetical protein SR187_3800 [Streptococcus ruminantium]